MSKKSGHIVGIVRSVRSNRSQETPMPKPRRRPTRPGKG